MELQTKQVGALRKMPVLENNLHQKDRDYSIMSEVSPSPIQIFCVRHFASQPV